MIVALSLNPALDIATTTAKVFHTSKVRCEAPRIDPGGGGINVARVVQRLGGEVMAMFTAGGHTGAALLDCARALGLPHLPIGIAGDTRESFTVQEGETGLQYRFVMPGPELSPSEQGRCLEALAQLCPQPSYIVATGSLPPGAPDDFYATVCVKASELGVRTILDTSGRALSAKYSGLCLMKPSLSELEAIVGARLPTSADRLAAAHDILARGFCEVIVVSMGGQGALWATAEAHEFLAPIPVRPRSAVGAGDSMVAAITLALAKRMPVPQAVRFGMAAGAAAVMTPGTELCRREDVQRLYESTYGSPLERR